MSISALVMPFSVFAAHQVAEEPFHKLLASSLSRSMISGIDCLAPFHCMQLVPKVIVIRSFPLKSTTLLRLAGVLGVLFTPQLGRTQNIHPAVDSSRVPLMMTYLISSDRSQDTLRALCYCFEEVEFQVMSRSAVWCIIRGPTGFSFSDCLPSCPLHHVHASRFLPVTLLQPRQKLLVQGVVGPHSEPQVLLIAKGNVVEFVDPLFDPEANPDQDPIIKTSKLLKLSQLHAGAILGDACLVSNSVATTCMAVDHVTA